MPPDKKVAMAKTIRTVRGFAPTYSAIPPKTPVKTRSERERVNRSVVAGRLARRWSWGSESCGNESCESSGVIVQLNRNLRAACRVLQGGVNLGLELPHCDAPEVVGQ